MTTAAAAYQRIAIIDPPVPLPEGMVLPPQLLQRMTTRDGVLWFRQCPVPLWVSREWVAIWKQHKLAFMRRGFSVRCEDNKWYLRQWLAGNPGNYSLTKFGLDLIEQFTAASASPALVPLPKEEELVLPPLPNGLEDKLYEYQRQPARQLYRAIMNGKAEWNYPGAWDCSDLGTGKTYQALAAAIASGLEVGVICPKAVIGTGPRHGNPGTGWTGAFAHFKQTPLFILNYESLRTGRTPLIRRSGSRFEWTCDPEHTILVWDEAHNLKNPSLNRSMAFAAARQGFPCIFVSGTIAQSPLHMGACGIGVGLHNGTRDSYASFLVEHGCIKSGDGFEFQKGARGANYLARIHRKVFPRRGARVRIADLGDRFPETQIVCEPVQTEATAEIAKAWREATETIKQMVEQGSLNEGQKKMLESSTYMKAWHMSERAKVPVIAEMARREMEEGRSVAIFVNFTDVRDMLMKELRTTCAIYGGQPQQQRDACIAAFQADAVHLGQALGRVHRAGGKSRSRQVVLFAADTVEESICASTRAKLSAIATLNDGDLTPPAAF